jgi:small subunit ribosomal protein S4
MGDPRKAKKQYWTPKHPWNKLTIDDERIMKNDYGLRNKKEIFIANSMLKKYRNIAKRLIADDSAQGTKEKKQMLEKLQSVGLLQAGAEIDNVLSLQLKDVLERRLQSVTVRKGLARTMKQARQFIVHRHITVGDREITSPAYIVPVKQENMLTFKSNSNLSDEEHPERVSVATEAVKPTTKAGSEGHKEPAKKPTEKAEERKTEQKENKKGKETAEVKK